MWRFDSVAVFYSGALVALSLGDFSLLPPLLLTPLLLLKNGFWILYTTLFSTYLTTQYAEQTCTLSRFFASVLHAAFLYCFPWFVQIFGQLKFSEVSHRFGCSCFCCYSCYESLQNGTCPLAAAPWKKKPSIKFRCFLASASQREVSFSRSEHQFLSSVIRKLL